jgi:ribosome-binding factor A
VSPDDEADPGRFFGDGDRCGRGRWKVIQLCKQVERAVAVTLASECRSDALVGAAVAAVEPAPDSRRLRVTVALAPGKGADDFTRARDDLRRSAAAARQEVGRSIHRKRVPEIVFEVRLVEEVARG